jgi:hypothetical protein
LLIVSHGRLKQVHISTPAIYMVLALGSHLLQIAPSHNFERLIVCSSHIISVTRLIFSSNRFAHLFEHGMQAALKVIEVKLMTRSTVAGSTYVMMVVLCYLTH